MDGRFFPSALSDPMIGRNGSSSSMIGTPRTRITAMISAHKSRMNPIRSSSASSSRQVSPVMADVGFTTALWSSLPHSAWSTLATTLVSNPARRNASPMTSASGVAPPRSAAIWMGLMPARYLRRPGPACSMLWYVTPQSTRSSPTSALMVSAFPMPFWSEKNSVLALLAPSAARTASPVWYVLTATKTRSNGSTPSSVVTTCTGMVVSSCPTRVMCRPASASSRARAWFTSSRVTSSPARVRYAPTSPPNAPAPTIRIRIAIPPAAPGRGSPVLPCRTALFEERRAALAHVLRDHQLTQEQPFRLHPRLLERTSMQRPGHAHVHPQHQRARLAQVAQHLVQRRGKLGLAHHARDESHGLHLGGRVG